MNREILRIALPAIVANITVPLLGLVDTAIAGHLGNQVFIGAVAVGAMMFNLVYWNFGFLRQAAGRVHGAGGTHLGHHHRAAMAHPPVVAVDHRPVA